MITKKFLFFVYVTTVVAWWLVALGIPPFLKGTMAWWEIMNLFTEAALGVFLLFASIKLTLKIITEVKDMERKK
ncbi:MAG TPA: hypothetical protein PKB02_00190 [Anaerohalosphaeraceae bacterium]|nr:hypothetical protein [Anaerohalosphaeraceae bacterium]